MAKQNVEVQAGDAGVLEPAHNSLFLCAITGELMNNPTRIEGDLDGRAFEREAIVEHLNGKTEVAHPVTGAHLVTESVNLVDDPALKEQIGQYKMSIIDRSAQQLVRFHQSCVCQVLTCAIKFLLLLALYSM